MKPNLTDYILRRGLRTNKRNDCSELMPKYLKFFPKPVLDDLVMGRWLPVVGAGMSLNAVVGAGKKMPLWAKLGQALSADLENFSPVSPLDAISAYEHEFTRAKLIERLSELLHIREAQPGRAHKEFCSIPFDIVCTTNFDFLLERQYDLTPRYVYPVVDEEQLAISLENPGTLLLKLHGDLRHPSRLIVSESDYDGFISKYPMLATYLSNQLITKTAVLIGYSLDDPDFRQLWQTVTNRLGRTRRAAYSLMVGAQSSDIARFQRRGVKIINLPGSSNTYGQVLAETFAELREYMRDKIISVSRVTDEQPLRELQLPRNANTRLCFFSVPLSLLPFYRERVFPLVEQIGFISISAEDVISPGDNISAKIDALIDRAVVMVCDLSSQWTQAEYRIALARQKAKSENKQSKPFHLIAITQSFENLPPDLLDRVILSRPDIYGANDIGEGEVDNFVMRLVALLANIALQQLRLTATEPQRLLQAGELRAAVLAAVSLLEVTLRNRLGKSDVSDEKRMSLRRLIDVAENRGQLPPQSKERVLQWISIRNNIAHSAAQVSKAQSESVVNGILEILDLD